MSARLGAELHANSPGPSWMPNGLVALRRSASCGRPNLKTALNTEVDAPAAPPAALEKKTPKSKRGGRRPGAGRKKGVPNKLTADVKAAIMAAFNEVGEHCVPGQRDYTAGHTIAQ